MQTTSLSRNPLTCAITGDLAYESTRTTPLHSTRSHCSDNGNQSEPLKSSLALSGKQERSLRAKHPATAPLIFVRDGRINYAWLGVVNGLAPIAEGGVVCPIVEDAPDMPLGANAAIA